MIFFSKSARLVRFYGGGDKLCLLLAVILGFSVVHGHEIGISSGTKTRGIRIQNAERQLPQIRISVSETDIAPDINQGASVTYQFDVDGNLDTETATKSSPPPSKTSIGPPSTSPMKFPTEKPTKSPSKSPTNSPSKPTNTRAPPTDPPVNAPSEPPIESYAEPTQSPTQTESRLMQEVLAAEEQQDNFLPTEEEDGIAASQREPGSSEGEDQEEAGIDYSTNEEQPVMAEESEAPLAVAEGETDADQFLPVREPEFYFVELRPFSVFVDADRDIAMDLGIPLYLFLEMRETLPTLVDIKITNLTIHMGVVKTTNHNHNLVRHRQLGEVEGAEPNHYHWNQLFFHGLAQFDGSTLLPPVTVQNVQSLVLSNEASLQQWWDNEGNGETYDDLELQNITLSPFPSPRPTEPPETQPPTAQDEFPPQPQQTYPPNPEVSKRDSNIAIMVSLVIVFFSVCFCIICLAGRLQYLSSRAQDKYNEKYGLDYNVYDKDIGKEIFKEEYLMSEHNNDDAEYTHSLRSIDMLTSSLKATARRSSLKQNKKPVQAPEEPSTEEEEEETQGSYTAGVIRKVHPSEEDKSTYNNRHSGPVESARSSKRTSDADNKSTVETSGSSNKRTSDTSKEGRNSYNSHSGPVAGARSSKRASDKSKESRYSSNERGKEKNVVIDDCIILPKHGAKQGGNVLIPEQSSEEYVVERVPHDEDIALPPPINSKADYDGGDSLPSLKPSCVSEPSGNSRSGKSARKRESEKRKESEKRRDSSKRKDSSKKRSSKDYSGKGSSSEARDRSYKNKSSFSFSAGEMGNSSRGSRGSRSHRKGSFAGTNGEELGGSGRGDRSTRSNRSIRSNPSESSFGSFYSCQGDLV